MVFRIRADVCEIFAGAPRMVLPYVVFYASPNAALWICGSSGTIPGVGNGSVSALKVTHCLRRGFIATAMKDVTGVSAGKRQTFHWHRTGGTCITLGVNMLGFGDYNYE